MRARSNVFPYQCTEDGCKVVYTGLKVRDYIAIQAMIGFSANSSYDNHTVDKIAEMAYAQADAMIKQSEAKDEQSI